MSEKKMAKGYEINKKRRDELSILGRELARRSGSKCELCLAAGVKLNVFELPPVSGNPDPGRCVFICDICSSGIANPLKIKEHWHCLNESIWSEVRPVKLLSVILLKKISDQNSWAGSLLENIYIDWEDEEWINSADL
jgi:protein PhnA